jgi:hypothetical protein
MVTSCVEPVPPWTADPSIVAVKVPDPTVTGAVTVAEYVPLPLSVTAEMDPVVPDSSEMVTIEPPELRFTPAESLAWTVRIVVDVVSSVETGMEEAVAVSVDSAAEAALPWVVNDADSPVTADGVELSVAVIVPVTPAVAGTVYTTVATPLSSVVDVAEANEPPATLADQVTTLPARATLALSDEFCS